MVDSLLPGGLFTHPRDYLVVQHGQTNLLLVSTICKDADTDTDTLGTLYSMGLIPATANLIVCG